MRIGLALAVLALPLGGCVVPPQSVGYGYGYDAPAGYGYPGYASSGDYGYPGYAYNGGSPTLAIEGATVPLIFYGGGWGYWDGYRQWHRAPQGVERQLQERHPGGVGYRPYGGGQVARPDDLRPPGSRFSGNPGGFQPGVSQPRGFQPAGVNPGMNHPGGPPAGGFQTQGQPQAQRAAAPQSVPPRANPVGRAEVQHERHRDDQH